jgi:hypothetical protein
VLGELVSMYRESDSRSEPIGEELLWAGKNCGME